MDTREKTPQEILESGGTVYVEINVDGQHLTTVTISKRETESDESEKER